MTGFYAIKTLVIKIGTNKGNLLKQLLNNLKWLHVQTISNFHPRFRDALATISGKIKLRNAGRRHPYTYLDPENLPNAISI